MWGAEGAPQGVVDFIEMCGVFAAAAATGVLALDTTDVLAAVRARPKAKRRRPKADLMPGRLQAPRASTCRKPKAGILKVRPALDWTVLDCIA